MILETEMCRQTRSPGVSNDADTFPRETPYRAKTKSSVFSDSSLLLVYTKAYSDSYVKEGLTDQ
jgi:hypothetical protein